MLFDFDADSLDSVTVANLYNAYENCYYCMVDDKRRVNERKAKGENYDWLLPDMDRSQTTLLSLEVVIKHFSRIDSEVEFKLVEIQEKIDAMFVNKDYKKRIAQMGDV